MGASSIDGLAHHTLTLTHAQTEYARVNLYIPLLTLLFRIATATFSVDTRR